MIVVQHAVDAEADAVFLFVGLHVNVAGAPLHRLGQDQVHQLDDRSFVGRLLQSAKAISLLFGLQLDVALPHVDRRPSHLPGSSSWSTVVGLLNRRP